jgi:crotonobetainyl-CoA:carnitine CoA-transferase CaiB-like acyl-CoA transferase
MGLGGLAKDPRFTTNGNRVDERIALRSILAERFLTKTSSDWLARFKAADVPASGINDVAAAFALPQARALGMKAKVDHPAYGRSFQVGAPFTLSVTPTTKPTAPPLLGEQSEEILVQIGYTAVEIARLRRARVI